MTPRGLPEFPDRSPPPVSTLPLTYQERNVQPGKPRLTHQVQQTPLKGTHVFVVLGALVDVCAWDASKTVPGGTKRKIKVRIF